MRISKWPAEHHLVLFEIPFFRISLGKTSPLNLIFNTSSQVDSAAVVPNQKSF